MTDTGEHDLFLPDYAGGSIVNVAASVLEGFGLEPPSAPLRSDLLPPAGLAGPGGTVLLVLDALGVSQLSVALASGCTPNLAELIEKAPAGLQQITSIFPSTTTAALNSLATACPPAEHGVLGHMLWFEEIAAIVNMLTLYPIGAREPVSEDLIRRVPTIYERLATAGVTSTVITDASFEGTPFTNLLSEGARFAGYGGLSQLAWQLERALDAATGPGFYSLYWPLIDTLAHEYGPDHASTPSPACRAEMAFVDIMVGKVADVCAHRGCTLTILADHGQTALEKHRATPIGGDLRRALLRHPGGARRAPYLTGVDAARVQADPDLAGAVQLAIPALDAVAANWFGGPCTGLTSRLGDTIVLADRGVQFLYDYGRGTYAQSGSHSGLTSHEMHVPLIVIPPA